MTARPIPRTTWGMGTGETCHVRESGRCFQRKLVQTVVPGRPRRPEHVRSRGQKLFNAANVMVAVGGGGKSRRSEVGVLGVGL